MSSFGTDSKPHLVEQVAFLERKNIDLHSVTENLNTTTSGGRLIFHMMAALAEFERHLISERTTAGMDAVRRAGKHVGRSAILVGGNRRSFSKAGGEA